jgi:hypothetical protein
MFELSNNQRKYFGLNPVLDNWTKGIFSGEKNCNASILYYENNTIKKHIKSTDDEYYEKEYDEKTLNKEYLLPKTKKGKQKKLTASVFERCNPIGVYCLIEKNGRILIGNYTTQKTFYDSGWEYLDQENFIAIADSVNRFIEESPSNHLEDIHKFIIEKRKHHVYKSGDFFRFKINRSQYGFGRVLLDVNRLRKKKMIDAHHGLHLLMGPPVLIKLYAYISDNKDTDPDFLKTLPSLPSDYIMDNVLYYGDYEIIGNMELEDDEYDFPISYGKSISALRPNIVFFQWGLIHLEKPVSVFSKYIDGKDQNPYGYYSIGYRPKYNTSDIQDVIEGKNIYETSRHYRAGYDLRNPKNEKIKNEIMKAFGIDPSLSYGKNAELTKTIDVRSIVKQIM